MKKKLLALCLAAGLVLGVNAQEKVGDKDLPASVQTSFKSQYPDATGAEWKMKDGKYKVHFKVTDIKQMAYYDEAGKLISKGVAIKESELPPAINTSMKSLYSGKTISEVYKIDTDGTITYLVKFSGDPETKVVYTAEGQVVKDKPE